MFGVNVFKLVFSLIIVHFSLAAPLDFFILGTSSDVFIVAGFGGKVEVEELKIGNFTKLLHSSGVGKMAFLLIPGVQSNVGSFIDASGKQKKVLRKSKITLNISLKLHRTILCIYFTCFDMVVLINRHFLKISDVVRISFQLIIRMYIGTVHKFRWFKAEEISYSVGESLWNHLLWLFGIYVCPNRKRDFFAG